MGDRRRRLRSSVSVAGVAPAATWAGTLEGVVQPMRRETDDQRRQRHLADSLEYAAKVARDPVMTRRIAETRAEIAANGFDERELIPYEKVQEMIRRLSGESPES